MYYVYANFEVHDIKNDLILRKELKNGTERKIIKNTAETCKTVLLILYFVSVTFFQFI